MEFWWKFEAQGLPSITIAGCGYTADLSMYFTDAQYSVTFDTEPLMTKIKNVN